MTIQITNADKKLFKAIKSICALKKGVEVEIDDDLVMSRADLKAYKKAKKELERGEAIDYEDAMRMLGLCTTN